LADIPWNGHKITNLGNPVDPADAATKYYVDNPAPSPSSRSISGADLNGRLNFTSPTGVNGITWTGVDMSWLGRIAEASKTSNRLVVNNTIDGTPSPGTPGTDLVVIDETGRTNFSSGSLTINLSWDGTQYRTIAAGYGQIINFDGQTLSSWSNDTATSGATYLPAAPRKHWAALNSAGNSLVQLFKTASGKMNGIYGYTGASSLRWLLQLGNATTESGSNSGSNFEIDRYADGGGLIDAPFTIDRASGVVTCADGVQAGLGLRTHGPSTTGGYGANFINFLYTSGTTLNIYIDNTLFSINMSACDYRIKQEVRPLASTWEAVKALKPVSYQLQDHEVIRADGLERWGFLAHEVQDTLTETAATGAKDGEHIQSLDTVAIIAALTTALQEAMLRIEALEARLA
jgi:hypothetical protein